MSSISLWMYAPYLLLMAASLFLGVWLFVMASRFRSAALWWLFVLLGPWPIVAVIARQLLHVVIVIHWPPTASGSGYWVLNALASGGSFLATFLLQCVVVTKIVAMVKTGRSQAEPICPRCGYNLTGLEQDRCPECGTAFSCEVRYITRPV
ncbi:MAG: hypothetical protein JXA69_13700 [Phycisphaerae bacterium]|nr:hypothetical protein [Phycisphaerae bacterium]